MKCHRWKHTVLLVFFFFVIITFQVYLQKTFKLQYFACCDKTFGSTVHIYRYRRTFHLGICHLACNSTFADQLVQTFCMRFAFNLGISNIGWTNSFMSFLSTFALCMILTEFIIFLSISIQDSFLCRSQRQATQVHGVSTHVSNQSRFIQPLCNQHCMCNRKAQFTSSFLL